MYGDNATNVAHVAMLDTVTYIMMMKMTCGVQCCEKGSDVGGDDDDIEEAHCVDGDNVIIATYVAMPGSVTYVMMMKMTRWTVTMQ